MAVHIVFASLLAVLGCFLQVSGQREVFRGAPRAHTVFLRPKRANQFLVEEILKGNLERECYEERCNFEEAREVFEDDEVTIKFWTHYYDGDQCSPNPCLNGGNCTDKVGGFSCSCIPPNYGPVCDLGPVEAVEQDDTKSQYKPPEVAECPTAGPSSCQHLCTADFYSYKCSCMSGFKLQSDMQSCQPEVRFPCGKVHNANSSMCRHGDCPWQVSLSNSSGVALCGGVVLGRWSVLTAARCLNSGGDLRPSRFYVVTGNKRVFPVRALFVHERFQSDRYDYDLALLELDKPMNFGPALSHLCLPTKDFSENVLMHSGRAGTADKKGHGQNQELVYMTLEDCRKELELPHPLSNKMFCMRRRRMDGAARRSRTDPLPNAPSGNVTLKPPVLDRNQSLTENILTGGENLENQSKGGRCRGLVRGSGVVTVEKGTAFLTGLLMSQTSDCGGQVFTKVSRYLNWIRPRLEAAEDRMTPQVSQYPEIH